MGLHDLRRTYRSALADLGVREEIAEAMIAHRRSGSGGEIQSRRALGQRREAAEKLDAWLASVVNRTDGHGAANIVSLAVVKRT